jgi:acyl-coenzyme A synthetase/AMP-(fatty) acid ligase
MRPSQRLETLLSPAVEADRLVGWRGAEACTWGDFNQRARRWQAAFTAADGQRFALCFADGLEFAAALFGLWQSGKQAWLPGDLTPATQAALRGEVSGWAGDGAGLAALPRIQPADTPAPPATTPLDPRAEALVMFTSGSTGAPEACPKRLHQLFDEIDALEREFGAGSPGAVVVASVSAQHVYGLLFRVLWPLATGRAMQARTLVYLEDLAELLPAEQRAVLIASPTHLGRLPLAVPGAAARIDQVFSSGAPLPDAALPDALRVFGQAPIEVYGSTETGGVAWRQRNPGAPSIWRALPGVLWRLDDGQLVIRSPHLRTTDWTPCADRAAPVDDGFELRGRADRVVKIAEKRVSLQAVEDALLQTPWIASLRLVMLDAPRSQLGVVAVPTAEGWALHDAQGRRALADALREGLLGVVERVALPRRWRFVPELPRNAQGKSTQARLLAEFDPQRPPLRELVRNGNRVELTLLVEATLPQFDGHFPAHPVLPGVAQVDWALTFGHELFGIAGEFVGMDALKFQQVIVPGTRLSLVLESQAPGRLAFRYHSAGGPHASGRLLFGEPAPANT